jgi:glycosyltransferase involved in cell wall biosynthesis
MRHQCLEQTVSDSSQLSAEIVLIGSIGAGRHTRLLHILGSYRKLGAHVSYVGLDRMKQYPRVDEFHGMPCRYLLRGWGYANWRLLFGLPLWCLRVFLYASRMRADLVHTFELESALPVALAAVFRGFPFIYDVQDNFDLRHQWPYPLRPMIRAVDGWVIRRAAGIVVPDENRIVGPFEFGRGKTATMPNCPQDMPLPPRPARKAALTVLASGHLGSRRGVHLLLSAAKMVPEVRVIMAGRFTEPWLEQTARGMERVDYRGWIPWEQAVAMNLESDVAFSFYDPAIEGNLLANSQKWFDAMMTGTPVLSNREIFNAQWIEDEGFGYLCPFGDPAALAETLRSIIRNPEELRRKSLQARRLFEEKYNWSIMEQKLYKIASAVPVISHMAAPHMKLAPETAVNKSL